jgi:hypothetical protein
VLQVKLTEWHTTPDNERSFRQMRYTSSAESIWQRMLDAFGADEGERLLDALERSPLNEVRAIAEQLRLEFALPHIDQADVPVLRVVDQLHKLDPPREALAQVFCAGFGFNLRVNRDPEAGKPGHGPCYTLTLRGPAGF